MRSSMALASILTILAPGMAHADEPPLIDHQPSPCTVPNKAMSICASISDDAMVSKARVYFRPEKEKYYNYADMTFTGLNYCATLPAPREGKTRTIQYYIQAVDDAYNTQRSSTYSVNIQQPELCGFPPIERDPEKAKSITVYGTHHKQGNKIDDKFVRTGVSFVPAKKKK